MTIHADKNSYGKSYQPRERTQIEAKIERAWNDVQRTSTLIGTWLYEIFDKNDEVEMARLGPDYVEVCTRRVNNLVQSCRERKVSPFAAVDEIRALLQDLKII